MKRPHPDREPKSTTPEKKSITKTHEEFIDNTQPSFNKQQYEAAKKHEQKTGKDTPDSPKK